MKIKEKGESKKEKVHLLLAPYYYFMRITIYFFIVMGLRFYEAMAVRCYSDLWRYSNMLNPIDIS